MPFRSVNPATGDVIAEHPALTCGQFLLAIDGCAVGFGRWSMLSVEDRCRRLVAVAGRIRGEAELLARLAVAEMGKPITQARAEVERCAAGLEGIAAIAPASLAESVRDAGVRYAAVRYEPLGVLLAVMPWNFPYWQIVRFAACALAAGNTVVVKPAPNTAGCAIELARLFREAGVGDDVLSVALAEVEDLEAAVAHEAVAGVSLTGSVRAGRSLAAVAGKYGKPAVLELGGSDPLVVLADADVAAAAGAAVGSRFMNNGQSCICAKRWIVASEVYDTFRALVVEKARALKVGDPMRDETDIGPLARLDLAEQLRDQFRRAVAGGARPLLGPSAHRGEGPAGALTHDVRSVPGGCFVAPEILELPSPAGPAWTEETFGPLAALVRADSTDHAVRLANDSAFGLGCSLWTRDDATARKVVPRLRTGNVYLNLPVRSTPALPFGGVKASGTGRELGPEGIRQFTNLKSVVFG